MLLSKYPRQFLVSSIPVQGLDHLNKLCIGNFFIYHCQTLCLYNETNENKTEFAILFGFAFDPIQESDKENDILQKILDLKNEFEINCLVARLSGRFALFIYKNGKSLIYNDACGLRTVFYITEGVIQIFGSQPSIIGEATTLFAGPKTHLFFHSDYFKKATEYWIPCGLTVWENVGQLLPNHYLYLEERKQLRFWPTEPIKTVSLEEGIKRISGELTKGIKWAHNRFPLALPLTSGFDSRVLLAASKAVAKDIFIYTFIHLAHLNKTHPDITIPKKILKANGLSHNLITNDSKPPLKVAEQYTLNNSTSHFSEAGILFSTGASKLANKVAMFGNVSEMGKVHSTDELECNIVEMADLNLAPSGWNNISFIKEHVENWILEANDIQNKFGISANTLFYWEHRLGNWAAQAYNENDFLMDVFTPFNSRIVLQDLLSIDPQQRRAPNYKLYTELSRHMWPEIMEYPCNPKRTSDKFIRLLKAAARITRINKCISAFNDLLTK